MGEAAPPACRGVAATPRMLVGQLEAEAPYVPIFYKGLKGQLEAEVPYLMGQLEARHANFGPAGPHVTFDSSPM
jgi:hypothetical protein